MGQSNPFAKALTANVQQDLFDEIYLTQAPPSGAGVFPMGEGGSKAPCRLLLMPFAEGSPGSTFVMRLYGWRPVGQGGPGRAELQVWVFHVLAQFLCFTGAIPGPILKGTDFSENRLALKTTENLCDSLVLQKGVLGLDGFLSTDVPGSGCPATALVEIYGAKYVSFDFAQWPSVGPSGGVIGMNCLWAEA